MGMTQTEKGDRILLLLKIKSILSPFVSSSIQFSPALLSFQRVLSALPRNAGNEDSLMQHKRG
jgi:hypothetical protein